MESAMTDDQRPSLGRSSRREIVFTGFFAALPFTVSLVAWRPYWQTNDDIAMSMVVHGYGISAYPSAGLVFSNVIYGWIVGHFPVLFDIFPYSVLSLALLFAAAWGTVYFVSEWTGCRALALTMVSALFLPAIVFPQFSVLAGLLTCAGIAGILHYAHRGARGSLAISAILLLLGFLVREQQFYLVMLVGMPFLPYRAFLGDRKLQVFLAAAICLAGAAGVVDHAYYRQPDWDEYRELNLLRAAFTDYGGAGYFRTRPELLAACGFTWNDIELVTHWFFADQNTADPVRLSALLGQVRVADWTLENLGNVRTTFSGLANRSLLPLIALVIMSFTLVPGARNRTLISGGVFCVTIGVIGAFGRPWAQRVYYPLVGSILVLTLMGGRIRSAGREILTAAAGIALVFVAAMTQTANAGMIRNEARIAEDFTRLDEGRLYIVWGAVLDYEAAYPVFVSAVKAKNYRWFALGAFSPAPYAKAQWREEGCRGLMDCLLNGSSPPIMANDELMTLLGRLMEEHYSRRLVMRAVRQFNTFRTYEISTTRLDDAWNRNTMTSPSWGGKYPADLPAASNRTAR